MSIFNRILRPLDRLIGLDQLKEAVSRQDAVIHRIAGERCTALIERDEAVSRCEAKDIEIARLMRELDRHRRTRDGYQAQADMSEQANAVLKHDLADARRACGKFQAQIESFKQAILTRDADLADLKHVVDQCEADRNSLAKERDEARAWGREVERKNDNLSDKYESSLAERNALKTRLDTALESVGRLAKASVEADETITDLRARISNAVDQLAGPREFAETKPTETLNSPADAPTALDRMGPQWIKRWDTAV